MREIESMIGKMEKEHQSLLMEVNIMEIELMVILRDLEPFHDPMVPLLKDIENKEGLKGMEHSSIKMAKNWLAFFVTSTIWIIKEELLIHFRQNKNVKLKQNKDKNI